jgi:hypothetical protein
VITNILRVHAEVKDDARLQVRAALGSPLELEARPIKESERRRFA